MSKSKKAPKRDSVLPPRDHELDRFNRQELKRQGYTDEGLTEPWEHEGPPPAEELQYDRRKSA